MPTMFNDQPAKLKVLINMVLSAHWENSLWWVLHRLLAIWLTTAEVMS